jgi:AraC-like DNA-binding protein
MNKRLNMTWIDLTTDSKSKNTLPIGMDIHFDIDRLDYPEQLSDHILKSQPDVICFEFDYPDRDSLGLMLDAKHNHSSIPMIMVTLQHSEKLAVWAFRSRLADYLVKPIPQGDIDRCHEMLKGMALAKSGQRTRSPTLTKSELPQEIAAHANIVESSFSPAIYYVAHNFDKKIQNDEVANLCAMSPFRFGRGFKNAFGLSFRDYVVRYRLREACRLLNNPNTSITDAAFAAGFSDVSYFGRLFKKHFGICPSEKYSHLDNVDGENQSPTAVLELPRDLIRDFVA